MKRHVLYPVLLALSTAATILAPAFGSNVTYVQSQACINFEGSQTCGNNYLAPGGQISCPNDLPSGAECGTVKNCVVCSGGNEALHGKFCISRPLSQPPNQTAQTCTGANGDAVICGFLQRPGNCIPADSPPCTCDAGISTATECKFNNCTGP